MNFSKPVGLIQRQERLHVHIIERPSRCHNLRCQGGVEWLGAKYPALQELSLELVCKPGDKSTDLLLDKSMALSKSLNSRALFVALHLCRLFVYVRSTKPGQPAVATPPNTGTTLDMIQSFATSCGLYKENEMEASAVRLMPVLESTSRRPTLNEHCLGQQTTSEAHIVEAQQHLRQHQHSRRHVWLKISWNQNLSTMHTIGVPKKKQGHRGRHLAGGPGRVSLALAAS